VFGDIVDTFGSAVEGPDVDGCNHLGSEDDVEEAILGGWPERDSLAADADPSSGADFVRSTFPQGEKVIEALFFSYCTAIDVVG
jgi:hypothetical protein